MPVGIIAAGVGAAGAIGSAAISSNAAGNAARTAANTAAANNALQSQIYQSNKGLETPYINAGDTAENTLSGFLGLGGSPAASQAALNDYLGSTGYQFDKSEGENAITNNKAASGLLDSGSTLQALDSFGTGLANSYGQQYESNLQGVANTGVSASNALAGEGENYANQVSTNNNNAAGASATAGLSSAASINGAISNAVNAFGSISGSSSFASPTTSGGANAFLGG